MQTKHVESLTNSMMMAMEKECRKNGLAGEFHQNYQANRKIVEGIAAHVVAENARRTENKNV